jgi:hypothetical protein
LTNIVRSRVRTVIELAKIPENCWRLHSVARRLQRITLTYGRGARVSIEESLFPRAITVHNN